MAVGRRDRAPRRFSMLRGSWHIVAGVAHRIRFSVHRSSGALISDTCCREGDHSSRADGVAVPFSSLVVSCLLHMLEAAIRWRGGRAPTPSPRPPQGSQVRIESVIPWVGEARPYPAFPLHAGGSGCKRAIRGVRRDCAGIR